MRRCSMRWVRCASVLATLLLTGSVSARADDPFRVRQAPQGGQEYVPGEVIVKFKTTALPPIANQILSQLGLSTIGSSRTGAGFLRARLAQGLTVDEMVQRLRQNPLVEYAEPNHIAYAYFTPNDQFYSRQWHLDNPNPQFGGVQAEEAWNIEDGDPSVVVAVVDTGVAYEDYTQSSFFSTQRYYRAPDLAQTCFVPGYDFVNEDTHPNDDEGHGTHVTGTIAQSTNNAIGTAGLAYQSCIMPVKVLNSSGSGSYTDISDGIRWAADHGAKVINMSLGGSATSTTLRNALIYAQGRGVTIVCSAGNNGSLTVLGYPAAYDECIATGATRYDEAVSYYSNRGAALDIVAPGGDLNVDQNADGSPDGVLQQTFGNATNDWGYFWYQGTSMAAPHVSAAAALVIAHGTAATPQEVRTALQSTAEDKGTAGWDSTYGWGLLRVRAALDYNSTPNQAPIANPGGPYTGTEDVAVSFNGAGSSDPENSALTYAWAFGDGSTGTGASPTHAYAAGGLYTVTLTVNDGQKTSSPASTTASITEVNDPPVANAGPDQAAVIGQSVNFTSAGSSDPDGSITGYAWAFGDGTFGSGATTSHAYSAAGPYTVTLTVTDDDGATASDTAAVTVTTQPPTLEVFNDSFEAGEWNGNWTEDSQNDWFRTTERETNGSYSAVVDGLATDAQLISKTINLQGRTNATVSFSWFNETGLDAGEYLAFDVSTNGGTTWTERARLRGNVDPENIWQPVQLEVTGVTTTLRLRFRGRMSSITEASNVDQVTVVAH